jgi:hypothetical protein
MPAMAIRLKMIAERFILFFLSVTARRALFARRSNPITGTPNYSL